MEYEQWVTKVEKELGDTPISKEAHAWIYRESFFDGYSIQDACEIALDPKAKFRGNWPVPA